MVLIRRGLVAIVALVAAWLVLLAVVLRLGGPAPAVFVPFPPADLIARLDGDVAVTGRSPVSYTLQSGRADLVSHVYRAGAWIVLPAGLEACIPRFLREEV